jgi:hypothetical protein
MLLAAPAFAQSGTATKQPTQEGGPTSTSCGSAANAHPGLDPNCKQRTQNLVPSPSQGMQKTPAPK